VFVHFSRGENEIFFVVTADENLDMLASPRLSLVSVPGIV